MSWYWRTYYNDPGVYSFIYDDGEIDGEEGRIEKVGITYHAYVSMKKREFRYLTDAKRWVEQECKGRATTKKRKGGKPAPFGL